MQRIFWVIIAVQSCLVFGYVIQWPSDHWAWLSGVLAYGASCMGLMWVGLKIAKQDKLYYLYTVASVSFNWLIFGLVGLFVSSMISLLNIVNL